MGLVWGCSGIVFMCLGVFWGFLCIWGWFRGSSSVFRDIFGVVSKYFGVVWGLFLCSCGYFGVVWMCFGVLLGWFIQIWGYFGVVCMCLGVFCMHLGVFWGCCWVLTPALCVPPPPVLPAGGGRGAEPGRGDAAALGGAQLLRGREQQPRAPEPGATRTLPGTPRAAVPPPLPACTSYSSLCPLFCLPLLLILTSLPVSPCVLSLAACTPYPYFHSCISMCFLFGCLYPTL